MQYLLPLILILCIAALSVMTRKLTVPAAIVGTMVGFLIFIGAGYWGLSMIGAFFLMGSSATSFRWKEKASQHLEEHNKGKRTTGQVLANGGIAALLGAFPLIIAHPSSLIPFVMACSISAAASDTLSSELGMVFGKRYYLLPYFKKGIKGANGVVSIEGTLCGIAGSLVIAILYAAGFGLSGRVLLIIIAGTLGNIADSLCGAWIENKGYIGNNTVNTICTLTGALAGLLLSLIG